MDDLIFALNVILPIIIIIAVGYLIKRLKIVNKETLNGLNSLCFKVFLPISLFQNIYNATSINDLNIKFALYISISLIVIFICGLLIINFIVKDNLQKGVILQALFRSNYAIIGIPLAIAIASNEGGKVASIVAIITIPIFNILATIALSIFVNKSEEHRLKKTLIKIIKNPLIIGIVIGIIFLLIRLLFENMNISFRLTDIVFLSEVISILAKIASPLALFTLGGLFGFSFVNKVKKPLFTVLIIRLLLIPAIFFTSAYLLFDFNAAEYAVMVAVFASPVAVSSAVMAKEMGNDGELANQIVVWSSALSSITIFIIVYLFRILNIF